MAATNPLPKLSGWIELPALLADTPTLIRAQNKALKDAMREVLLHHWKKVIPRHFSPGNRGKYRHQARSGKYKAWKARARRSTIDLVKSGTSRNFMRGFAQIRVGGQAHRSRKWAPTNKGLRGSIRMRWPFPVNRSSDNPRGVTIDQMSSEIETWTQEEIQEAAQRFGAAYARNLQQLIRRSPRVRNAMAKL